MKFKQKDLDKMVEGMLNPQPAKTASNPALLQQLLERARERRGNAKGL